MRGERGGLMGKSRRRVKAVEIRGRGDVRAENGENGKGNRG